MEDKLKEAQTGIKAREECEYQSIVPHISWALTTKVQVSISHPNARLLSAKEIEVQVVADKEKKRDQMIGVLPKNKRGSSEDGNDVQIEQRAGDKRQKSRDQQQRHVLIGGANEVELKEIELDG